MKGIYRQFMHPTGPVGALVGHLMAFKNRARGAWVTSLLELAPGERVLEVGFGPGADAGRVLDAIGPSGAYLGVDSSVVMVRQATRRNRRAADAGRARFVLGDVDRGLPDVAGAHDAAFAINCAQFWADLHRGVAELARALAPGGRLVVAVQPRNANASAADSARWAERLAEAARAAGLDEVTVRMGPTTPPVAAVRARRPLAT